MSAAVLEQGLRLLALPCAGASATMYLRWRRQLPDGIALVPVELPGRGERLAEPCVEDFASLVARLCDEQAPVLQGRYALFGHSMGALLAYGIAHRQRTLGRPLPEALLVSASAAPSRRDPGRFPARRDDAALIADLQRQGGTPEAVFANPELLRITLDTLGADYRLCESFTGSAPEPLSMPVHVLAARDDDIAVDRIEAWRGETHGASTLDWFDGGHFYLREHEAEVIALVAREVGRPRHATDHAATATA